MEKTEKKRPKKKTLQITYPAPYSQSWNPDVLPVLMKNNIGRASRPLLPKRIPPPEKEIKPNRKPDHVFKVPQYLLSKRKSTPVQKKPERKKSTSRFPPVFLIRNKEKTNSRQLSQSKIMHIDIKPKTIASLSPSFCPSPSFRTARKISPRRYRLESPQPLSAGH